MTRRRTDRGKPCETDGATTRREVYNHLRLLRLPPEVIEIVQQGALVERTARLLVTLPPDEAIRIARGAIRRPDDARADYVARCVREARARLQPQAESGDVDPVFSRNRHGQIVPISSERSSFAPETCPHCWKVPRRYAREEGMWVCGECGRTVRVSVTLAGV